MQQGLDNAGEAPTSTGAKDIDLLFLRGIMESPTVRFTRHKSALPAYLQHRYQSKHGVSNKTIKMVKGRRF